MRVFNECYRACCASAHDATNVTNVCNEQHEQPCLAWPRALTRHDELAHHTHLSHAVLWA